VPKFRWWMLLRRMLFAIVHRLYKVKNNQHSNEIQDRTVALTSIVNSSRIVRIATHSHNALTKERRYTFNVRAAHGRALFMVASARW
jgi:hypothetical protein